MIVKSEGTKIEKQTGRYTKRPEKGRKKKKEIKKDRFILYFSAFALFFVVVGNDVLAEMRMK